MSEYPPGSFEFASSIMGMHVRAARRDAEAQRLARQAGAARPKSQRLYRAALASLGQHFLDWGASLRERYGGEESTPTPACT